MNQSICNFKYLIGIMGDKKPLIKGIMDAFLIQIPAKLTGITNGIAKMNYDTVKNFAHTMKSSVSIMGIIILAPILNEMESLGTARVNMERIKELNLELNSLCVQAIEEIETEKYKYA